MDIDTNIIHFYASNKCKHCYGRGYENIQEPGKKMARRICSCVYKAYKKGNKVEPKVEEKKRRVNEFLDD